MKKYILYAEDDPDDFWVLKQAFNELNSNTVELVNVPDGYDVIRYLQALDESQYPSLILLDLIMPTLNGKETLNYLKMDDRFSRIPIVCISTSASP
ncbi:MAG TPA: response regulator, partial [Flavisolibacter sp.]|nr:response regulator [Flavisolibacter sp.]